MSLMASLISAREMSHDEDDDTNFLGSLGGWTGNFPQTQCLLMMYLHVAGISLVYVGDDFMYMAESYFFLYLIMSLPLGSRRIIFLGCLSIYPSTWLSICQSIHLTSAVLHRWQTDWLTDCQSVCLSLDLERFLHADWAAIWYANVSWPP